MRLSDSDLISLRTRCARAVLRDHTVAKLELYAEALADELEIDIDFEVTPQTVVDMVNEVIEIREDDEFDDSDVDEEFDDEEEEDDEFEDEDEDVEAEEAEEAAEPETVEDVVSVSEDVQAEPDLDRMTKAELLEIAQKLDVPGRSVLNKDDLLLAVKAKLA